jgi:hypothetical protein
MAKPAPSRLRPKTSQFSIRLPDSAADRADRLLETELLERLPLSVQRLFVSRGAVLRECLLRGLDGFESDIGLTPTAQSSAEPAAKPKGKGRKAG